MVKHLPAMWETQVWSLGRENPLEKEMATHSSVLTWKIPWTKESSRRQSMESQRVGHDWLTSLSLSTDMNWELPDVQAGFRNGRGTRNQIASISWIIEKEREFQKNIYFCFIDYAKAFDCVDHNELWEILKKIQIPYHITCLLINLYAVKKQQSESDLEQWTGSKLGKEYIKVVYCHHVYLTCICRVHHAKFQTGWRPSWN